jgi:hypothetical protein
MRAAVRFGAAWVVLREGRRMRTNDNLDNRGLGFDGYLRIE